MPPPITRPGTPPLSHGPQLTPPTEGAPAHTPNRPGSPSRPDANSSALVRYGADPSSQPTRRSSLSGTEAAAASSAASGTVAVTRRRAATAKLHQAEQAQQAASHQLQLERLITETVGSTDLAAMQSFFETNVPQLFGRQAPAQQRLTELLAGHGIPDAERLVRSVMQTSDRIMTAMMSGAASGSGQPPTLSRQEAGDLQRLFEAVGQVRTTALPPAEQAHIRELETEEEVAAFLAGAGGPPDVGSTETQSLSTVESASTDAPPLPTEAETTSAIRAMLDKLDLGAVLKFIDRVLENRTFDTKTAQWLATTVNVILRNLASVGATTFGRELLAFGIELGLQANGVGPEKRRALSALMGPGYSTLTHMMGAFRDVMNDRALVAEGFEPNPNLRDALIGRGISAATAIGAFFLEDALDLSKNTTAVHSAMTAYTHGRDVGVQSWLRLPAAQDPAEDAFHFKFMSVMYGLDQMLTPMAMMLTAPLSGASAARAGHTIGQAAQAAVIRAGWNTAGEVAEDLLNEGNRAIRAGHAPEVGLAVDAHPTNFVNGWLGQQSVRSAIISEAQSFAAVIAHEMTKNKASPIATLMITALMIGLVNGVQYWPFARGFAAQPKPVRPTPSDVESGLDLDRLDGTPPPPVDTDTAPLDGVVVVPNDTDAITEAPPDTRRAA